jgi:glycosyltransferase involved in cell wall biosynthesis
MQTQAKILLVVGSMNQGGAEFQLLSLARLLQSRGHDIEVLALTEYTYFLPFIKENKILYSCVSNEGNNLKRLIRAIRQLTEKKPDLVISYIKRVSQVAILSRVVSGFSFKLIISERTSLIKPWHDLYYFNLALLANKLTINSISKFDYIRHRFPLLKKRTVFIPNIINIEKFSTIQRTKAEYGSIRISYVGRISSEKNLLNLIKAISIIIDKGYNVTLSLTGEANNKKYLQEVNQLIVELNLSGIVKYQGPTKDITGVYERTDLLCLISIFEGLSNVLSEAIACGIPVIASNIPENRYLVEDKLNGFLVEANDPHSIADGIERFLKLTPNELKFISESNKSKAKNIFDEDQIYAQYQNLINSLF